MDTMEEQTPSERPVRPGAVLDDMLPLWMKIALSALFSFSAIIGIWRHGLKNWDWFMSVVFLGIVFFLGHVTEPLGRNLRWPLRVVFLLWVIACSALFVHFWGWVPALALAGLSLLSPSKEKGVSWKAYLQKPQNVIFVLLFLILIIWFARDTGGWVPTACVVATFLLLEGYSSTRRSLGDNLRRRSVAAVAAIAIFAAIWAWLHLSFENVVGLVIVIVLVSSDIYLHTEEDSPLHASQSRS